MRERDIEKKVCDYAKKKGMLNYKFVSPSANGVPDRIFFHNGSCILIEFKATGAKTRPNQNLQIKKIRRKGIPVFIIDNVDDGIETIDFMLTL